MKVPALMAAICLTTLSACAQPGPDGAPQGYGQGGPPPGYGQGGPPPGYGQDAPPPGYGQNQPPPGYGQPAYAQNVQPGAPGAPQNGGPQYGAPGGWAGGMQGAGGQPGGPPPMGDAPPPPMPQRGGGFGARFQAANVTHDGRLTLQQAQAAGMGMVVRNFAQIDRDQKGYVTMQDVRMWRREVHAQKMGQPPAVPGGQYPGTPAYPPPAPAGGYGAQPPSGPPGQQY